jgi:signal peptidase I
MNTYWFAIICCLFIFIILILALIRIMLVVITVENTSMLPTLKNGDRVLLLRYWPTKWLRKGHIVLVWPWKRPRSGIKPFGKTIPFIKRVVGLPGDTIVTYITELDDFHRIYEIEAHDGDGRRIWYIPSGHFFVRGDHPIGGFDSLSWGPIPFHCLLGIVILKLPRKSDKHQIPAV